MRELSRRVKQLTHACLHVSASVLLKNVARVVVAGQSFRHWAAQGWHNRAPTRQKYRAVYRPKHTFPNHQN